MKDDKDNKNVVEQAENSASKIGKFNTADDLLAAYNALEGEFTKRCQLIKQLQAELEQALSAQAPEKSDAVADATQADPAQYDPAPLEQAAEAPAPPEQERTKEANAVPVTCDAAAVETAYAPSGSAAMTDAQVDLDALRGAVVGEVAQNAAAYAEALCALPEIMDACVARYKRRLIEARVIGSPSGVAVIAPPSRPRSLADAKALADKLISKS